MNSQLGSWYEHPLQSICILQHSPISVWFYPSSNIYNCLQMPKKSQINNYSDYTLNSIWRGCLHYAKSTSNHPSVKPRCLKFNPILNQPKHHSSRFVGANWSITYLHKTFVKVRPQESRSNGFVGLVLSFHHLFDHHLRCRAFPVTKEITRTKVELKYVSECRKFSYCCGLCFYILELHDIPTVSCLFEIRHVRLELKCKSRECLN